MCGSRVVDGALLSTDFRVTAAAGAASAVAVEPVFAVVQVAGALSLLSNRSSRGAFRLVVNKAKQK